MYLKSSLFHVIFTCTIKHKTKLVPGVLDSDVDPVNLTYVVPGNDDSTDSILLYHKLFASAIIRAKKADEVISKKATYRKT